MSQLLFWVRYIINERIEENVFALVVLEERRRGVDVFNAFLKVVDRFSLDLKKLKSVCTDGAPPMIGNQENLCAKAMEKNCSVLKTITKVSVFDFSLSSFVLICLYRAFIHNGIILL